MNRSQFLTFMYYTGYLTPVPSVDAVKSETQKEPNANNSVAIAIPSYEIWAQYCRWLESGLMCRLFRNRLDVKNSVAIFRQLFSGPFAALATSLSQFIADRKLASFTTSNCHLYPFYLLIIFTAAIKRDGGSWRLTAERRTGLHDRVTKLFIHGGKNYASIHEYRVLAKSQGPDEYGEAQREQLTKASVDALGRITDLHLRTKISPRARELREVGIAFMGDCCAIVARQLVRKSKDDDWVLQAEYTAAMDESRRAAMYATTSSRLGSPTTTDLKSPVGGSSSVGQPQPPSPAAAEPRNSPTTKTPSPSPASPPSLSAAGPPSLIPATRPSSPSAAGVLPRSPSPPHASSALSTSPTAAPAASPAPPPTRSKRPRSLSPARSPLPTVSPTAAALPAPAAPARAPATTLVSGPPSPTPREPVSEGLPALESPSA
ncbi:hypothetical protein FA95DRAFT_1125217 [Auriscalpium vulgare]|uniref:Uncharacterized protein n=1 Tax=Auriscalpium vulgare TaxID=40419 RepID=A0ACB8RWC5_9AGAM|nr:hypothetical protein FA95DRAFT_1125217 [Auriscalpium vulgare]